MVAPCILGSMAIYGLRDTLISLTAKFLASLTVNPPLLAMNNFLYKTLNIIKLLSQVINEENNINTYIASSHSENMEIKSFPFNHTKFPEPDGTYHTPQ